jgi:hypothetical protein
VVTEYVQACARVCWFPLITIQLTEGLWLHFVLISFVGTSRNFVYFKPININSEHTAPIQIPEISVILVPLQHYCSVTEIC